MKPFWKKNHVFWKMRNELKKYKKKSKYLQEKCDEKDKEKLVELRDQKTDFENRLKEQKEEYEDKLKSQKNDYEDKLDENTKRIDRRIDRYNRKNYKISEKEIEWDKSISGLASFIGKVEKEVYDREKFIDEAIRKIKEGLDNIALVKSNILDIGNIKSEIGSYISQKEKKMLKAVK